MILSDEPQTFSAHSLEALFARIVLQPVLL